MENEITIQKVPEYQKPVSLGLKFATAYHADFALGEAIEFCTGEKLQVSQLLRHEPHRQIKDDEMEYVVGLMEHYVSKLKEGAGDTIENCLEVISAAAKCISASGISGVEND